jgi:hypothetical protein
MTRVLSAMALTGILVSSSVSAATDDLVSDWATSNPNGTWSFLQGTGLLPYQSTPLCCGLGVPAFAPGTVPGNFLPAFWQSAGPGTDIYVHSVDPANGNPALGEATLVWTAPATGTISYSGYLYYAQSSQQRSNDVTFSIGAADLFTQEIGYTTYTDSSDKFDFSGSGVSVTAGETLSLEFVRLQFAGTVTGFDLVITESSLPSTPEPSTWVMMLVGLTGLGYAGFRRAKSGVSAA